jgi:2-polyprenyl-6-methoxyphenol hydroxylase-like FAD-dependent oxidoreductase
MSGLLSARVLSEHFEQVLILERDPLPQGPEAHKGTPQARHVHAMLEAGMRVLDDLFPALVEEMLREGVERIDMGRDTAWHHYGAWKPRYTSGYETILCTRSFLEWKVRERVVGLPNVELRQESAVDGLLTDATRTRVTGVKVKGETLEADLVVDATGRGSRAPRWLEELGYGRPEEEQVGVGVGYASRFYERPETPPPGDWKSMALYARAPESWRSGFISNVEGGRWIVSLSGYFGDHPPTDEAGFLEYARSLSTPHLYEAIRTAKPLTQPVTHAIPTSRWLHFERMRRFPDGFMLLGDSVCAINPVYGQGMTLISLGARLLGECLAAQARATPGNRQGLAWSFQKKLAGHIGLSWFLATTMDLRYPQTQGKRPFGLGLLQWSVSNLVDLTSLNQQACDEFYRVLHFRGGMEVLFQPKLALALLSYSLKSLFVPLERRANVDRMPPLPDGPPFGA